MGASLDGASICTSMRTLPACTLTETVSMVTPVCAAMLVCSCKMTPAV